MNHQKQRDIAREQEALGVTMRQSERAPEIDYPMLPTLILWLFLGFVIFRYLQGGYRIPALGAIRFEAIVGAILTISAVFLQLRRKPKLERITPLPKLAGWVLALTLLMLIHVITSADPKLSWEVFIERVIKFGLFGFMIFSFVSSPTILRYFLAAYLLSFMRMTYEGIAGYISGSMVWQNQGIPRLHGSTPSYFHPNSLGGTQLSTLAFVVPLWPISPRIAKAALCALGCGAILVSIFSGSRTAYVALGVWLAYMIYRTHSKFRALAVVAAALLLISPLIPDEYYQRFSTIFTQQEIEGASMSARQEILSDAITIFLEHPFGIGVGAFPTVRDDYFGRYQDTHSLYLEIATNLGIPGIIVFSGLIAALFRSLRHVQIRANLTLKKLYSMEENLSSGTSKRYHRQIADLLLIRQVAVAVTGFLIIRLALGLFGHDLYEIYLWFTIGLTAALLRMSAIAELKADHMRSDIEKNGGSQPITSPPKA